MPAPLNLKDRPFGRLVARERVKTASHRAYWRCSCACGGFINVRTDHLLAGETTHCGCARGT